MHLWLVTENRSTVKHPRTRKLCSVRTVSVRGCQGHSSIRNASALSTIVETDEIAFDAASLQRLARISNECSASLRRYLH